MDIMTAQIYYTIEHTVFVTTSVHDQPTDNSSQSI